MKSSGNFEECEQLSPAVGVFGLGLVHNQLMTIAKKKRYTSSMAILKWIPSQFDHINYRFGVSIEVWCKLCYFHM